MIPVTGSSRIPSKTAFYSALSSRFLHTSHWIWPEKILEDGGSIAAEISSRRSKLHGRKRSDLSIFPVKSWNQDAASGFDD